MMYNYYLSLPLAIGITLLNTTFGLAEVVVNRNYEQFSLNKVEAGFTASQVSQVSQVSDWSKVDSALLLASQSITENSSSTTAQAKTSNYLGLMNAGYAANQKQDYLTAFNYFQQALNLQPGDSKAEKAIKNLSSYGFDLYMRTGYTADKVRDYTTALQSFQKALQIRPDSLHAKQAVNNVTYYLAQQPVDSNPSNEQNQGNGLNLWLMLMAIGAVSALSAVLLFYLFKKTGSSIPETELGNSNSTEETTLKSDLKSESTDFLAATPTENDDRDLAEVDLNLESEQPNHSPAQDREQPQTSSFTNSKPTTPIISEIPSTESNNNTDRTSVVSSSSSLAKLDIVPELIRDLSKSDRSLRRKAVWELAQRGDSRAMKPLVELMVEVDSQERGLILEAMTQIAGRTLKPMNKAIMMSLQDENSQVKQNAIRDLTRVYELMSQITKRLSEAVEDSDVQVQETAKWALHKLNQMPANSTWQTDNLDREINNFNSTNSTNGNNRSVEKNYPFS
jgi:tetratricopeptide (TPR) repeat protein